MSASSKKKLRKEQNAAVLTERQRQEQAEAKKLKRNTTLFVILIAAVICAFLAIAITTAITTQGWAERSTTAATINGEKLNSVDMNYYYSDTINAEYNQYGEYAASMFQMMGLDTTKPLDEQSYNEETGETWADYFMNKALAAAQRDFALSAAAEKAGYTLSEDDKASLENVESNLTMYASFSGMSSADAYLRAQYGNGASVKSYVKYLERNMLAENYYAEYSDSQEFDATAIAERDEKNPLNYNAYDFEYYYVDYSKYLGVTETVENIDETTEEATEEATEAATEEATEAVTEAATEAATEEAVEEPTEAEKTEEKKEYTAEEIAAAQAFAKSVADKLALSESAEAFEKAVAELEVGGKKDQKTTHSHNTMYEKVNAAYSEWISDASRKEGDIAVFENNVTTTAEDGTESTELKGYYVVCYEGMTDNRTSISDVRHLLVKFGEDDEEVTEEMKAKAKEKAESLLKEWQDGEATEDSFITLVSKNTEDEGSAQTGGLYEKIHERSSYVENFLNWSIAEERTEGETGIVETEYGYHIMYFVKRHERNYRDDMIFEELKTEAVETWYNALYEAVKVEKGDMKHLNTSLVLGE